MPNVRVLVGRDAELRSLLRHAARRRPGGPGIAVVRGGAGMGKTFLLDRFAEELTGHVVLRVAAASVPTSMSKVTGGGNRAWPAVAGLAESLGVRLDGGGGAVGRPHVVGQWLLSALAVAAAAQPVTIIVDDADLIDIESADAIGFAARRLFGQRVLLALAVSDRDSRAESRMLPPRGEVLNVPLARLTAPQIQALAHAFGLIPFGHADAETVRQHAGGNPRYVVRLLAEIGQDPHQHPTRRQPALPSATAAITARIARLPVASRSLLAALSVLDDRCPLATVASVAGVTGVSEQPLRALEPLLAAGLVQWWPAEPTTPVRIRTALQRQASYQATAPGDRRALHDRAALMLPAGQALLHRLRAEPGAPNRALADDLAAAAWRWIGEGNLDRAAQHLLWAADVSEPGAESEYRLLLAISLLHRAGRYEAAAALRDRARACTPSPLRGIVLGRFAMIDGDLGQARELLTSAIVEVEADPDGPRFAQVAAIGHAWLALVESALGKPAMAARAAGRCLAVSPFGRRVDRSTELLYLQSCCELDGPVRALARLRRLADLPESPSDVDPADSMLLVQRGHFRLLLGDPAAAAADLEAGLRNTRTCGTGEIDDWAHLWAASAHLVLGATGKAATHAAVALSIASAESRPHVATMLAVRSVVEAHAGELAAAAEHAAGAADLAENFGGRGALVFAAFAAAALARAKGDPHGVIAALRPFASWRGGWPRTYRWLWWPMYVDALLDVAGAAGEAAGALAEMGREVACGFGVLTVAHLHLTGRAAEAAGDLAAARSAYQRAVNSPSALAHPDRRARAAESYRLIAADPSVPGSLAERLTIRERAIARMIADGLSNRDVSAFLGVAEKTVEAHLTRMYRKLSIRSRRELGAALQPGRRPPRVLLAPCVRRVRDPADQPG